MEQHNLYDLGLNADLAMWLRSTVDRRKLLKMGAVGLSALLAGCQPPLSPGASNAGTSADSGSSDCLVTIPSETAGPYPADGSSASNHTLNALDISGMVRRDIRTAHKKLHPC